MNTFCEALSWIWLIGGVLLYPFNGLIAGAFITYKLHINYDTWFSIVKKLWVLQIVWNIIFFSIGGLTIKNNENKITYTLTRVEKPVWENLPNGEKEALWDYHFYTETAEGKKEIGNTPFQKAISDPNPFTEFVLDRNGLHLSEGDYKDFGAKLMAFHALPENEARAYIDRFNAEHSPTHTNLGIFLIPVAAVIYTFMFTVPDILLLFALLCPIGFSIIFGPTILLIVRDAGLFSGLFRFFDRLGLSPS